MTVFLILVIAIVSVIMIIMGYVAPYVFLQYYATKDNYDVINFIS